MKKIVKYILSIIVVIFIISILNKKHQDNKNTKEITLLLEKDNIEINADIKYSVESIKKYLNENNIKLVTKYNIDRSGYILKYGSSKKYINTAMTNIDLLEICGKFYNQD